MTFLNAHLRKLNNQVMNHFKLIICSSSSTIWQNHWLLLRMPRLKLTRSWRRPTKDVCLPRSRFQIQSLYVRWRIDDTYRSSLLELDEKVRKLTSELKESSIGLAKAQKSKHEAVSALKSATDEQSRVDGQLTVIRMVKHWWHYHLPSLGTCQIPWRSQSHG